MPFFTKKSNYSKYDEINDKKSGVRAANKSALEMQTPKAINSKTSSSSSFAQSSTTCPTFNSAPATIRRVSSTFNSRSRFDALASPHETHSQELRAQLNKVLQAKRQLSIKLEHWERIKRITKDEREIAAIDFKLYQMRMEFLQFSSANF
ncbi:ac29 [Lambdina fiscellaria nucleopolyhedrovirus]|uniref:Ac29 n=1 Tax=Lambdina fiscellaria nucleopolyhedrovirus TaxID=1642929 RepID=A0A0E3URS7_9ABAC|nr:ac29 [Lambdina fiscellaria nucleopolyhedrovirus]AKC91744.1 ac29 [Lambdina fiscellaria nucleopolyhedrovirus]